MSPDTLDIILKHIEQLRDDVRQGFERIDGRLTRLEERVSITERWQAERDAIAKALDERRENIHASQNITISSRQLAVAVVGGILALITTLGSLQILNFS